MCDDFVLPDGSRFDTDVGLGGTQNLPNFRGYGRFLDGTRSCLKKYGLKARKVDSLSTLSAEVGDDEISVDTNPVYAAAKSTVYTEFLGIKESPEDTCINPRFGNFAEDLVIVPDGYEQTYRYAQQTSCFRNMAFLDVPKLRLAIDIRPGRMNHSSTNDGKAGMLGSRLAWLPRDSPVRCTWEMFNLFQDINLGLCRDDKFAYLPTALGGYGKPVPFGHAPNFEAFCVRYKQGTHAGLARELVRRTNRRFSEYTVEHRFSIDPILSAVSRLQSSWHDWIKGKSLYAPTCWLEAPPEVAELRVRQHGNDVRVDSALRRLESAGYLVTENDLAIAWEHNSLCKSLLGKETHNEFVELRKEKRKEWLNLSTFSLRLYGLITPLMADQSLQGQLGDSDYLQFSQNLRNSRLNLRMFLRQENYYLREAKDLVYTKGPMKVVVPLVPKVTKMGRRYWFEQTRDAVDDTETTEEFDLLLEWVRSDNVKTTNPPMRRTLSDDPFIVNEIGNSKPEAAFCVVTDDVKLCREAFSTTRRFVIRVPVKWYYMDMYYGTMSEPWLERAKAKFPFHEWATILDTGSIESYEEIGFRDGSPILWPAERPFRMMQVCIKNGRRVRAKATSPDTESNEEWEPYRFPEGYMFVPGYLTMRHRHPVRRGWA